MGGGDLGIGATRVVADQGDIVQAGALGELGDQAADASWGHVRPDAQCRSV